MQPKEVNFSALDLINAARQCLGNSYSPYSKFPVAAAVIDESGRIFTGVNIENASYGLTMCAERVAIFTAIAFGARKIKGMAVFALSRPFITPCGACRQVLSEFCDGATPVYSGGESNNYVQWTAEELLPSVFVAEHLNSSRIK